MNTVILIVCIIGFIISIILQLCIYTKLQDISRSNYTHFDYVHDKLNELSRMCSVIIEMLNRKSSSNG